jgi:hypothetical protein
MDITGDSILQGTDAARIEVPVCLRCTDSTALARTSDDVVRACCRCILASLPPSFYSVTSPFLARLLNM